MSIWIVCTYLSFNIFENLIKKDNIYLSSTIIFAISTAYLISIRVTGVLILIQYLISLSIYISTSNINIQKFLIKFYSRILIFVISFLFFIYLFYPLYWLDPLKFVSAIKEMGRFYNDVCTNTLGTCMYAKDLTYIPIWLSVKLPLIILIGILLLPFTEKKYLLMKEKKYSLEQF